jgi:hypothetical protein
VSILFEPLSIGAAGSMVVKNRFVRSATHDFMGNVDGSLSDREFDLYRKVKKGPASRCRPLAPYFINLAYDYIEKIITIS